MPTTRVDAFRHIQAPPGVPWHGRRQFLQTLVWGGGAACLTVLCAQRSRELGGLGQREDCGAGHRP